MGLPIISADANPNMVSAALFQSWTFPFSSMVMMASPAVWTTERR